MLPLKRPPVIFEAIFIYRRLLSESLCAYNVSGSQDTTKKNKKSSVDSDEIMNPLREFAYNWVHSPFFTKLKSLRSKHQNYPSLWVVEILLKKEPGPRSRNTLQFNSGAQFIEGQLNMGFTNVKLIMLPILHN